MLCRYDFREVCDCWEDVREVGWMLGIVGRMLGCYGGVMLGKYVMILGRCDGWMLGRCDGWEDVREV